MNDVEATADLFRWFMKKLRTGKATAVEAAEEVIAYMNIKADESQESLFNDIKKYEDIFVNSTINSFKKDLKEAKEK